MGPTITMEAPLLLRNLITPFLNSADTSLKKYRLIHFVRYFLISFFFFLLHLLHFFVPNPPPKHHISNSIVNPATSATAASRRDDNSSSAISRSLCQLLTIVNDIPVSSRKYEFVRSLAEKIIDENLKQGSKKLSEVNCNALSAAFSRTVSQLDAVVLDQYEDNHTADFSGRGSFASRGVRGLGRVSRRVVRYLSEEAAFGFGFSVRKSWKDGSVDGGTGQDGSWIWAEKWAAELLWLAEKLTACGGVEQAVEKWASASDLASRLSLFASSGSSRLQGSLVRVSAFLMKQAKDTTATTEEDEKEGIGKQPKAGGTKMKLLMSWLPLLCRASNGTDSPVLSGCERNELEGVIEGMIDVLQEEEQEKVLSLWIHHFAYCCASSDWPNLLASYNRWCDASRRSMEIGRR